MESWDNTNNQLGGYIRWIEFSRLTNMQQTPGLDYRCTHTADWSESVETEDSLIKVMLKKIVDAQNAQSYDFYKVIILIVKRLDSIGALLTFGLFEHS